MYLWLLNTAACSESRLGQDSTALGLTTISPALHSIDSQTEAN